MYLTFFTFGVQGSEVIEDDTKAAKNTTKAGTAVSFPRFFIILNLLSATAHFLREIIFDVQKHSGIFVLFAIY